MYKPYLRSIAPVAVAALAFSLASARSAQAQVFVNNTTSIAEYTPTGTFLRNVVTSGLTYAYDCTFGPDGLLYVADGNAGAIKKFNPDTGAFLGSAVTGLSTPTNCEFGADGSLYVAENGANRVVRVNAATGIVQQTYTGITSVIGLEFMPGGDLLATEGSSGGNIRRINTTTGTVTSFVASTNIADVYRLPSGDYVFTDRSGSRLHRTSAAGGSFSDFSSSGAPSFPYFMDSSGDNLYVGSVTNGVYRYSISTGAFLNSFGASDAGGVAVRPAATAAPEPSTLALLAFPGLLFVRARRRNKPGAHPVLWKTQR